VRRSCFETPSAAEAFCCGHNSLLHPARHGAGQPGDGNVIVMVVEWFLAKLHAKN
jgi:hypothetical protein